MLNRISSFEMERIAARHRVKLWLAKRSGRQWAFVIGGGQGRNLPAELIGEIGDIGIFVEGEEYDPHTIIADVQELLAIAV